MNSCVWVRCGATGDSERHSQIGQIGTPLLLFILSVNASTPRRAETPITLTIFCPFLEERYLDCMLRTICRFFQPKRTSRSRTSLSQSSRNPQNWVQLAGSLPDNSELYISPVALPRRGARNRAAERCTLPIASSRGSSLLPPARAPEGAPACPACAGWASYSCAPERLTAEGAY